MSGSYEITIRQGDTFNFSVAYKSGGSPVDLTGYTAEMVVSWPIYRSGNALPVEAGEVMATMASLDATGRISASMTIEQTASIPTSPLAIYQLRIRNSDNPVTTLLSGSARVLPDIFEFVS